MSPSHLERCSIELRRTIIRLLLWSLAIAAAAGVLAVVLPWRDFTTKITLTGIATAITAAVALGMTKLIEREKSRAAGLFGLVAVIVFFGAATLVIWVEEFVHGDAEDALWVTLGSSFLAGICGVFVLLFARWSPARLAVRVGVISILTTFALFEITAWSAAMFPALDWQWRSSLYSTGWIISSYGLLIAIMLIGLAPRGDRHDEAPSRRLPMWRWAGRGCGAVAGVFALLLAWNRDAPDLIEDTTIYLTCFAAISAYVVLALQAPLKSGQGWVRIGSIGAASVTAALICWSAWPGAGFDRDDFMVRATAAGGIVTACGSMALILLAALNRRLESRPITSSIGGITIDCPRCGKRQDLPTGESACANCALRFRIEIEEPHCPRCDYLLYGVTSGRCPECGLPITAAAAAETIGAAETTA